MYFNMNQLPNQESFGSLVQGAQTFAAASSPQNCHQNEQPLWHEFAPINFKKDGMPAYEHRQGGVMSFDACITPSSSPHAINHHKRHK